MIDAVVLLRWRVDAEGNSVPDAVDEVFAWAVERGDEIAPGCYGKYEDITGQVRPALRALRVFAARLVVGDATAQHFADDNRLFILGWRRFDDEGRVVADNWDRPLDAESRQRALTFLTNHGYTLEQITSRFSAGDSRREIARKLRTLFQE